ncbi:hypothetical protein AVEN_82888-1, partial [Araneus ventricosus]
LANGAANSKLNTFPNLQAGTFPWRCLPEFATATMASDSDWYVSLAIPAGISYGNYGLRFRTEFCMRHFSLTPKTELTKMASSSKPALGLQELVAKGYHNLARLTLMAPSSSDSSDFGSSQTRV